MDSYWFMEMKNVYAPWTFSTFFYIITVIYNVFLILFYVTDQYKVHYYDIRTMYIRIIFTSKNSKYWVCIHLVPSESILSKCFSLESKNNKFY